MRTSKKQLMAVYNEKGLNSLYAFMKRNKITYTREVYEFGLQGSRNTFSGYSDFLDEKTDRNTLHLHLYSVGVKSRKNGYSYNIVRGIEIKFK